MKKKLLAALALGTLLVLHPALAEQSNAAPSSAARIRQDGWVKEGGAVYYYIDGKKASGFTNIDNKTYFFDPQTGAQKTGFVVYGGKKYYFSVKTGQQMFGWVRSQGSSYYCGRKGFVLKGFQKIGAYRYYFNGLGVLQKNTLIHGKYYAGPSGRFQKGWVTANGSRYYFSYTDYAAVKGWRRINGKVYHFNPDGTLKKMSGVVAAAGGQRYYYDPDTGEMTTGWVHYGVNDYYFSPKTGRALKGWQTIKNQTYYFNSYGQLAKNRFVGNAYYVNEKGQRQYGWVTANDKTFYLDPSTGKLFKKKGWQTVEKKKYYFGDDYSVMKNAWINDNQYLDENGAYAAGWRDIDGKTYYFSKSTKKKLTGWKRVDDKVYLFGSDGVRQTLSGLVRTSDGLRYYYDPATGEMVNGWVHHGVNDYYFSLTTGRAFTGWHTIDGQKYYFNSYGQLAKNRFVGASYYVNETGQRQYGWLTLGDQKYYLNPTTGAKTKGWKTIDSSRYYFDASGNMTKDAWVGSRYLTADGVMAKNTWIGSIYVGSDGMKTGETRSPGLFKDKDGLTYFLDTTYQPATGWLELDGKFYHFADGTGVMDTDKWVDGYYLNSEGIRTSGALLTIDGSVYLFLSDGTKANGLTEYNGNKYYFSTTTGAMQTGFKVIDEKTYYFNPSKGGAMAVNTDLQIDGLYYTFDANGHMTAKIDVTLDEALGRQIAAYAQNYIGYPYVWGGDQDLTKGVDCSGFTMLVMRHFGINIPRTTWAQYDGVKGYKQPIKVAVEDLKPGDLIFYYAGNTHVGIYIGDGKIVNASNSAPYPQGGIKIQDYDYAYIYGCVRYWYK